MKKKGALLASSAMVLAAAAALTTASFAWFTTSLTPSVGDITMSVTSAESLMISAKADADFKSSVSEAELTAVTGNQLAQSGSATPHKIFSVTPNLTSLVGTNGTKTFASTDGTLAFQSLNANPGPTGTWDTSVYRDAPAYADGTVEMPYVMFDLYFKSTTEENVQLTLDLSTGHATTYAGTQVLPIDDTGTEITDNTDPGYYVTHSLRLAFVATKEAVGTTAANYTVKTYEPNATPWTAAIGAVIGESTYDSNPARGYAADAKSVANGVDSTGTPKDLDLGLTLEQNKVYKVRCYIWMEGNDQANANLISASSFKTMLKFTGVKQ